MSVSAFSRSIHSTRHLVDRRVANASNPKDIELGLTVEQIQLTKAYVVDALLVGGLCTSQSHVEATLFCRIVTP